MSLRVDSEACSTPGHRKRAHDYDGPRLTKGDFKSIAQPKRRALADKQPVAPGVSVTRVGLPVAMIRRHMAGSCKPPIDQEHWEATVSSCEPDSVENQVSTSKPTEPLAEYRWSGLINHGEILLFESTILMRYGTRLYYEYEQSFQLDTLRREFSTFRYRRRTFFWGVLSSVVLWLVWEITLFTGEAEVGTTFSVTMFLLIVMGLTLAVTHFPLVTAYGFHDHCNSPAFAVYALGKRDRESEQFVSEVVRQIEISTVSTAGRPRASPDEM